MDARFLEQAVVYVAANSLNVFEAFVRMSGGSGRIEAGDCIATISGQSMAACVEWDGRIEIEEEMMLPQLAGGLDVMGFTDSVGVDLLDIMGMGVSDVTGAFYVGAFGNVVEM